MNERGLYEYPKLQIFVESISKSPVRDPNFKIIKKFDGEMKIADISQKIDTKKNAIFGTYYIYEHNQNKGNYITAFIPKGHPNIVEVVSIDENLNRAIKRTYDIRSTYTEKLIKEASITNNKTALQEAISRKLKAKTNESEIKISETSLDTINKFQNQLAYKYKIDETSKRYYTIYYRNTMIGFITESESKKKIYLNRDLKK